MTDKKLSVIEAYEKKGYLDRLRKHWTASDRCRVGIKIGRDYYRSHWETLKAINYEKDKVDVSIKEEPEFILEARDRYIKAMSAIPDDFRETVRRVCCENKPIKGIGSSERQKDYDWHSKLCDLCRGLDYLINFYLGIGKKI